MGSYTSIEAGFELSIPDIDKALGQITNHPGRDAIVTTVDRFHPKTGVKTQKASKTPAIRPFKRVTIHYGGKLYIDKLVTDKDLDIPIKQQDEAWQLLGTTPLIPQNEGINDNYADLMEHLTFDLNCDLTWTEWGHFVLTDRAFCQPGGRDFISLAYYDDLAVRTKISDLKTRLEQAGFQNLEFGFYSALS